MVGGCSVVGRSFLLGALLVACGQENAPVSKVGVDQGGGGMGGSAGSLTLDMSAGTGGAAAGSGGSAGSAGKQAAGGNGNQSMAGAPTITLHTCPGTPEPPCPEMVLPGDVDVRSEAELAALQGVTAVEGKLDISAPAGFDALSCLRTVGDNLDVDVFGAEGDVSLWGLRNLQSVGGSVDVSSSFDRIYADCGLSQLVSLGEKYVTGGAVDTYGGLAGELDLSHLKLVRHIRLRESSLTRLVLPSNQTMTMGQLLLEDQPYLSEVAGFSGVTIQSASLVSGAYSVRIVDNPRLSTCRANELAQLFVAGGSPESTVTISGNEPCSM